LELVYKTGKNKSFGEKHSWQGAPASRRRYSLWE